MNLKKAILYPVVFVAVFALASYATINILLKTGATVMCPDVRGLLVENAKRLTDSRGLSLNVLRYEPRSDIPYGYITVQKPEANITIRKGRVVNVLVSEGPQLLELPNLVNGALEDAEKTLAGKQIEIEKTIYVPGKREGKVMAQIPDSGTKVLEGASIVLFVGQPAHKYYLMPETKGADMTELTQEMDAKGIKYKLFYGRTDTDLTEPGTKIAATPPRSIIRRDDEVVIIVNGG